MEYINRVTIVPYFNGTVSQIYQSYMLDSALPPSNAINIPMMVMSPLEFPSLRFYDI